jgi:acyl homoserine lactone synthase
MIIAINGCEKATYPYQLHAMHRIRGDVFYKRLNWDVSIADGLEKDLFDEQNPLYLLSVDELSGSVRGSVRLLPTTGPNMLRDIFPYLMLEGEMIESATIWECSRFSIAKNCDSTAPGQLVSGVAGELLAAVVEIGLSAGLTEALGVFDARMIRIFRAAGYPPLLVGKPQRIGSFMTYAGLFEISEKALLNIREAMGFDHSVLEPVSAAKCLAA